MWNWRGSMFAAVKGSKKLARSLRFEFAQNSTTGLQPALLVDAIHACFDLVSSTHIFDHMVRSIWLAMLQQNQSHRKPGTVSPSLGRVGVALFDKTKSD